MNERPRFDWYYDCARRAWVRADELATLILPGGHHIEPGKQENRLRACYRWICALPAMIAHVLGLRSHYLLVASMRAKCILDSNSRITLDGPALCAMTVFPLRRPCLPSWHQASYRSYYASRYPQHTPVLRGLGAIHMPRKENRASYLGWKSRAPTDGPLPHTYVCTIKAHFLSSTSIGVHVGRTKKSSAN